MTGLFDWLISIWENLKFFRIVSSYEQGVRFRRGQPEPHPLGAGIWFYWPIFDRIEVLAIRAAYLDLPTQSVTTADGRIVTFSANVCYETHNAVLAYTEVHDLEHFIVRAATGHLHGKIHEWTHADLMSHLKDLEKSLEGTLETKVKKWGVRILDVKLTDMAATRTYRLFGDVPPALI